MIHDILIWPEPRLRKRSAAVGQVDRELHTLIEDMFETMYATENGIGLAAPQIGVNRRVVVIDTSRGEDPSSALVLVNPEITRAEGELVIEESCLSVPGEAEEVTRAEAVWMTALDGEGAPYELEADGLLAIAIQHEIDHLDGVLYVDHLSTLKREVLRRRMKRVKAEQEAAKQQTAR